MIIRFRDDIRQNSVFIDCYKIQFCNDIAYFSDDREREFQIPATNILQSFFRKVDQKMIIRFRDELGQVVVPVDCFGIQFCDGLAYFDDSNEREYKIPVADILSIEEA